MKKVLILRFENENFTDCRMLENASNEVKNLHGHI